MKSLMRAFVVGLTMTGTGAAAISLSGCSGTAATEKKDKMSGEKMGSDKMGGDKMGGEKMGGDKMGGDKMKDKPGG
jgi:pentapeptide MXKDX repeat protein